jgi:hypothetical protein
MRVMPSLIGATWKLMSRPGRLFRQPEIRQTVSMRTLS